MCSSDLDRYGDHRDLHPILHSFPTRRSSDHRTGMGALGTASGPCAARLVSHLVSQSRRSVTQRFATGTGRPYFLGLLAIFGSYLAGVAGFEPAVHGTKNRCLTTWLHPNAAGCLLKPHWGCKTKFAPDRGSAAIRGGAPPAQSGRVWS